MTIAILALVAILGAGCAFRWRQATIERDKQVKRKARRREQQEAWERMLRETGLTKPTDSETPG